MICQTLRWVHLQEVDLMQSPVDHDSQTTIIGYDHGYFNIFIEE